jgi:hypothetical protein
MELQLASIIQYKLLKFVGKEVALPLFMDNITTISTILYSFKGSEPKLIAPTLKNELEKSDISHKIVAISEFIKRMSDEHYKAQEIHIHLCGIYEILDDIKNELEKINEESNYIKTSWYHYTIGWTYFSSSVNVHNIKSLIVLLDNRYDMLLKVLMATR